MKNKKWDMVRKKYVFVALIAVMALFFTISVYAQGKEGEGEIESIKEEKSLIDFVKEEGLPTKMEKEREEKEEPRKEENFEPLTPDGNMNLVDDYGFTGTGGKQFITLTTKSGNYFYLIIDRDDKGKETVHFLNLVDEADLLKLMEDKEVKSYMESQGMAEKEKEKEEKKPEVNPEEEGKEKEPPKKKEGSHKLGIPIILLVIASIGMGGFFFLKARKGKRTETMKDPDADYLREEEDYLADMEIEEDDFEEEELFEEEGLFEKDGLEFDSEIEEKA